MAGTQEIGEGSDNPVGINITAMVDVIFCLCLFFMCSFHFKQLEGKIESWLPKDKGIFQGETSAVVKDEIRVIVRWNAETGTSRKVKTYDIASSDDQLVSHIVELKNNFISEGKSEFPLIIDFEDPVPWFEIIHVMDLCKQNGIERIEMSAPEAVIEPTG